MWRLRNIYKYCWEVLEVYTKIDIVKGLEVGALIGILIIALFLLYGLVMAYA